MNESAVDLMQGTLEVLILRALAGDPMHGYGIAHWLRTRTDGVLQVQDAALYQALRRMERKGWVEAEWGVSENNRRARYYTLSAAGRRQLTAEHAEFDRMVSVIQRVLAST